MAKRPNPGWGGNTPAAVLGEDLAVSYSGGFGLSGDIAAWLEENNISAN